MAEARVGGVLRRWDILHQVSFLDRTTGSSVPVQPLIQGLVQLGPEHVPWPYQE